MIAADQPGQGNRRVLRIEAGGAVSHLALTDIATLFEPGDLVVANDAATLPASLIGVYVPIGAAIEVRLAGWGSSPAWRGRGTMRSMMEGASSNAAALSAPSPAFGGSPPPSQATWEEPISSGAPPPFDPTRFIAVVFGAGDYRTRTEDRSAPPTLSPGDRLALGPLVGTIDRLLGHPRLVELSFKGDAGAIWAGLADHGRPIQYAHVSAPLALPDVWTRVASVPVAFEPPSAGFALDWRTLAAWRKRGVGFATLTHAAGISSTGDPTLDARLPCDEPYRIPERTAAAIARTRSRSGRVIAIGTSVVRALEAAYEVNEKVDAGEGIATGRIGEDTELNVVDAILSGVHELGESHFELLRAFVDDATLDRMSEATAAENYRSHEFGDFVLIERQPRLKLFDNRDDRAVPAMSRRVLAAKLRSIDAGRAATVQK